MPFTYHRCSFRALATGERGVSAQSQVPLSYKGSIIHRSIPGFMIQGGGSIYYLLTPHPQFNVIFQILPRRTGLVGNQYTVAHSQTKTWIYHWTPKGRRFFWFIIYED